MHLGHKVTIALIAFVSMMSFLVYKTTTIEYNLVAEDYYQKELEHQDIIDATSKTLALSGKVVLFFSPTKMEVNFPTEIENKIEDLSILFFRPSDIKLDKNYPIGKVDDKTVVVSTRALVMGNYQVQMNWTVDGEAYYYEESVYVN